MQLVQNAQFFFHSAVNIAATVNPNVKPNNNAPFLSTLRDLAGSLVMGCLIVCVIAIVVGAAMFAIGKIGGNGRATDVGFMVCVWVLVAAAIIGSASGLVMWGSGWRLA